MVNRWYPILFMMASTFSLSLTGLVSKFLTDHFEVSLLSFLRFLVPAMMLVLVFVGREIRWPSSNEQLSLWIRALCLSLSQVCFIFSLQHLTLMESVVLFATGPLFIPVLENLIFSTPIKVVNTIGLVVTFVGVTMLSSDESQISIRLELIVGLCAGLFNAGSQLSLYKISQSRLNAFEINFWSFLYAAVVVVPMLTFSFIDNRTMYKPLDDGPWLVVIALSLLGLMVINTQVFRSKAYQLASSGSELAPVIYTNLVFTAIWQCLFFQKTYNLVQFYGLILIILTNVVCAACSYLDDKNYSRHTS
ncbi:EamA family transporter [Vibrio sp. OCN044]|uniref:EamA family transporter n=1 Tax=Vibrio tetraodonis subsp. pristinus TaxID=2695891 RepID=A0A6L8LWK4_9VIBR|nr:DMT family transporter [Vibrio tetraodonis]MYM60145.1 EamA family transporter [Vibrio tetraodonis subsp. pristinus]